MATREYTPHRTVRHDGVRYRPGDGRPLTLTDDQAEPLLACGAVTPAAAPKRRHRKKTVEG